MQKIRKEEVLRGTCEEVSLTLTEPDRQVRARRRISWISRKGNVVMRGVRIGG